MANMEKFGAMVKEAREAKGMSRFALAKEAGISQSEIAELEEGKRFPRSCTVLKIAAAVGIDRKALIEALE